MSGDNITLDRANLLRLVEVIRGSVANLPMTPEMLVGHQAATDGIEHIAAMMPTLYGPEGCPDYAALLDERDALAAKVSEVEALVNERDKYLAAYSEMFDQRDEYGAECKRMWAQENRLEALADEWDAKGDDLIRNCYSDRDVNEGEQIKSCARELRAALGDHQ